MAFCDKDDIKDYIEKRKSNIKEDVQNNINKGFPTPTLAIIQVGDSPASNKYINGKIKDCEEVGMNAMLHKFEENISAEEFASEVVKIVHDNNIHGVIIQKPLPSHIEQHFETIIAMIPLNKDVDGFKIGSEFNPCTPKGVIDYIEYRKGKDWLTGRDVVIINRSELVGKPLAKMMLDRNATVTVCHSKTERLKEKCCNADVIVSAVGKPKFIKDSFISVGTVCIDVGICFDENGKMCGDFDREKVLNKTIFCTPVPGGVGLMTRLALLENMTKAYELQKYNPDMIPTIKVEN